MEEIWPKESHYQTHRGDGDQGCGFIPTISNTHVLFLHFHLIGDAIPSHHSQLDAENGHDDNEKVPTPDVVDVKAIGEETDGRDAPDDPGEARGFEPMVEEAFIDQRTDDWEFHFLFSSVKI
jgi:hypothetical protein